MIFPFPMILVMNFQITKKKEAKSFFAYFQHLRKNTFDILQCFAFPKIKVVTDKTTKTFTMCFKHYFKTVYSFHTKPSQKTNFKVQKLFFV